MIDINQYLTIPYLEYGRDEHGADCWGLVRMVRHALRGDWLPSFGGIGASNRREMTDTARRFCSDLVQQESPVAGAIAFVWYGRLCIHVGIVVEADGNLAVLETCKKSGVRWMPLHEYSRIHSVTYHDDLH